jgi:hypothetical protein
VSLSKRHTANSGFNGACNSQPTKRKKMAIKAPSKLNDIFQKLNDVSQNNQ